MTGPLALAVALSLASSPAQLLTSQVPEIVLGQATTPAPQVYELNHSWPLDGALTLGFGALWLGSEALFKDQLAPDACRLWCERNPDGSSSVNGLDAGARAVRWSNTKTPALISDAMVYGVLPLTVAGLQWNAAARSDAASGVWVDYLLILESAALAQVANQAVKFIVGRERPYSNALPLGEAMEIDANVSFYSGHSTFAFALTVAAGTVSSLRGYKHAWMLWAVAVPLAATVPYFRMAADKHYLTDVLVGSLMGAAFGVVVPLLHGRADPQAPAAPGNTVSASISAAPGGISIAGTF